jgi:hypothetical protein
MSNSKKVVSGTRVEPEVPIEGRERRNNAPEGRSRSRKVRFIMSIKSNNKQVRSITIASLVAGYQKHLATGAGVVVQGATRSSADVVSSLQQLAAADHDVEAARGAFHVAVAAQRALLEKEAPLVSALKQYVQYLYGTNAEILADFGLAPHKTPRALNVAEKTQMVAQVQATREARGVIGTRKRAKIRGKVAGPEAPQAQPGAPTPAATPPPSPPPVTNGGH